MSNVNFSQLTAWTGTIDIANDLLAVWKHSNSTLYGATPNQVANLTSSWVGINDSQTLTNKTLTSPTINGATLSGTLSGTYTIGGTPTFPSSVATLTGNQTLTNKTLTSPAITGGTIDNSTVTVDTVAGHTVSNTGTIYGISVTTGTIGSAALAANSVTSTAIASGALSPTKEANPVKFFGFLTNAVSLAGGSGTTEIPYDTKTSPGFDTGSNLDVVTNKGRFTVPSGGNGFYQIGGAVGIPAAVAGIVALQLFKNGSLFVTLSQITTSVNATITGSIIVSTVATDFWDLRVLNVGTTANSLTGQSVNFWGVMVSAT